MINACIVENLLNQSTYLMKHITFMMSIIFFTCSFSSMDISKIKEILLKNMEFPHFL